ncbi:hypothetical protein TNCV_171181 [Trichonephila clavipes]|nr:hypothetical protein TNCV_171181 [Trichonephila clavipes]
MMTTVSVPRGECYLNCPPMGSTGTKRNSYSGKSGSAFIHVLNFLLFVGEGVAAYLLSREESRLFSSAVDGLDFLDNIKEGCFSFIVCN